MENEGIMSLPDQGMPETDENLYLAAKQAAMDQAPEQTAQFSSAIQEGLGAEGMTAADAQQLLQLVDYIIANAANYPQIRQQLIAQGLADPEDLPEQFNPQFFAALKAGLLEFITSGAGPTMPMAQGGLASLGRFGDTQLAHISPEEAAVLRSMGGRGSINPRTGLPEYFSFKSFLKTAASPDRSEAGRQGRNRPAQRKTAIALPVVDAAAPRSAYLAQKRGSALGPLPLRDTSQDQPSAAIRPSHGRLGDRTQYPHWHRY